MIDIYSQASSLVVRRSTKKNAETCLSVAVRRKRDLFT